MSVYDTVEEGIDGNDKDCVVIDCTDSKNAKRRVVFVKEDVGLGPQYRVRLEWIPHKYHPTIVINESEFKEFIELLGLLAEK